MDKPYSKAAELAVIGAVLIDAPSVISEVVTKLTEDYFYFSQNRLIFSIILDMYEGNEKIDLLTVKEKLRKKKQIDEAGGEDYINDATRELSYIGNIDEYIKIVEDKFVLRHLIETSKKITEHCYSELEVDQIIDLAESEIFKVQEHRYKQDIVSIESKISDVKKAIEKSKREKKAITGIPTGFADLDSLTTGFHPGEFIVLAARPGVGKTSFALNMLINSCVKDEFSGLIFSLEMTSDQLIQRMLCSHAQIPGQKLRKGMINSNDYHNITVALNEFSKSSIYIDDSTVGTPIDVKAKARRLKKDKKLDFLIIDYLQMMRLGRRAENKQIEVSEISRSLKLLAKELNIPVISLAQLSRNPERRENKKPVLSDIRDSGSIEQDADVVIFIHRDFKKGSNLDDARLIIAKQRNGPVGEINVYFDNALTQFKLKSIAGQSE
ncbi:MAG: replicative DNA helicase [candidate division WOR-3 bacterium]|nr:replicative DNA helicase [candidate division WOR-3 bacterium]